MAIFVWKKNDLEKFSLFKKNELPILMKALIDKAKVHSIQL